MSMASFRFMLDDELVEQARARRGVLTIPLV